MSFTHIVLLHMVAPHLLQCDDFDFIFFISASTLGSFCRIEQAAPICFTIQHFIAHGYIHGYIELAIPKEISLGLFTLPIL